MCINSDAPNSTKQIILGRKDQINTNKIIIGSLNIPLPKNKQRKKCYINNLIILLIAKLTRIPTIAVLSLLPSTFWFFSEAFAVRVKEKTLTSANTNGLFFWLSLVKTGVTKNYLLIQNWCANRCFPLWLVLLCICLLHLCNCCLLKFFKVHLLRKRYHSITWKTDAISNGLQGNLAG